MKKIFEIHWDGVYTWIEEKTIEKEIANNLLQKCEYDYKSTFPVAKKAVLKYMKEQLDNWKVAISEFKKTKPY